ncbi:tRNA (N6-threonylcarbamoyladenosine(37)-N6)-methyltransferase TrmO [Mesorhizobium sp. KR9-304]|uniref:tRNA (N6-threonylcarbamoyladenosine(37)-N6)-methyltransferase TrmO n=1 Tax=Mesorhizobium sp. KR9-304 TaxID=3156614 RepID=UPI0032B59338
MFEAREGEIALAEDPGAMAGDARLVFIGRIRSPWNTRADCPKNMAAARTAGLPASVEIEPRYRRGLGGLAGTSHVVLLSWLGSAPRNLIVQKPRHASEAKGVFALRSPARPNPVGLHVARLIALDEAAGLLTLDAIDVLDGTPLLDIKPYFASIDSFPDAMPPRHRDAP